MRKGGRSIQKESDEYVKKNGRLNPTDVAITGQGRLRCKHLMHAVGPIYSKSFPAKNKREAIENLTKCITNILNKANELEDVKKISMPSFMNGFPVKKCSQIVLEAIVDWCKKNG